MAVRVVREPNRTLIVKPSQSTQVEIFAGRGEQGKSAYEIALANGFVGTEQNWLSTFLTSDALNTHINDTTPHAAYDDLPSLKLLFENGII